MGACIGYGCWGWLNGKANETKSMSEVGFQEHLHVFCPECYIPCSSPETHSFEHLMQEHPREQ